MEDTNTSPYNKAVRLLADGNVRLALSLIAEQGRIEDDFRPLTAQAEALLTAYDPLLEKYASGDFDYRQQTQLAQLTHEAYLLAEQLIHHSLSPSSSAVNTLVDLLHALPTQANEDDFVGGLFERIASATSFSSDEVTALHDSLLDDTVPEYLRATVLSAVLLSLTQHFNDDLIEVLYVLTFDDQPAQLQMQAWVTLTFAALLHAPRICSQPRLTNLYHVLTESEPKLWSNLQIDLLQCREALHFEKKMKQLSENESDSEHPSEDNVRRFFEVVTEGIDMQFNLFAHLKKIPFFSLPEARHHWFEPFSTEQPQIKAILEENPQSRTWIELLRCSVAQCETDKYGALLTMRNLSADLLPSIGKKLEEKGVSFEHVAPIPASFVLRNYLHDLFRYCKMHPKGKTMAYPLFDRDLDLSNNVLLSEAVSSAETLLRTADFLFRKERWEESIALYEKVLTQSVTQESLQHLAYAYRHTHRHEAPTKAISALVRCNTLFPGDSWTLSQLADLYDETALYPLEEEALRAALEVEPDTLTLLIRLGRCLLQQHREADALEPLYQADLKNEGSVRVQRMIAEAHLWLGQAEQAEKYISRVLAHKEPNDRQYVLGGHIALLQGKVALAAARYQHADALYDVIQSLRADRQRLLALGLSHEVLSLMDDYLCKVAVAPKKGPENPSEASPTQANEQP